MAAVCDFRNMSEFRHAFARADAYNTNEEWGIIKSRPEKECDRQLQHTSLSYQPKALLHFLHGELGMISSVLHCSEPDTAIDVGVKRWKSAEVIELDLLELF